MIATEPYIGLKSTNEALFFVITGPVGAYYPEGFNPVKITVCEDYSRAGPGGLGAAKTAANYAASLLAEKEAIKAGYTDSCSCQPSCPCLFGSAPTLGHCEGVTLVEIESGHYGDVQLDGINVLAVYRGAGRGEGGVARRLRVLLAASLLFYTLWIPVYLLLLLATALVNWLLLQGMTRSARPRARVASLQSTATRKSRARSSAAFTAGSGRIGSSAKR